MQRSVASVLSIFLPPLLPYGAADMEVSHTIQTAGLVAMGMLYMGSGNRCVCMMRGIEGKGGEGQVRKRRR